MDLRSLHSKHSRESAKFPICTDANVQLLFSSEDRANVIKDPPFLSPLVKHLLKGRQALLRNRGQEQTPNVTLHRTYTKYGPQVHGPPLWTRSMDHLFGPGPWTPSWTTPLFKRQRTRPKVSERMFKFPKFWIGGPSSYRFEMYLFLKCRYLWSRFA